MNIIEESFKEKKENKPKRTAAIILAIIILLVFIIIGIFVAIIYLQNSELKVSLDGKINENIKQMLLFEDGKIYLPIRNFATQLGYQSFNGEYNNKSENASKCYIQSDNEVVNFALNSKKIYKLDLEENSNYETYTLEKEIIARQGVLYILADDANLAFNMSFVYDEEANRIRIYTMDYLIKSYESQILDYNYTEISEEFVNHKSILSNMLIVRDDKQKYGVINASTGEAVLEAKYDSIKYIPISGNFIVESNKKFGVMSDSRQTLVQITYDDIQLIDTEAILYLVKKDNKYGVVDRRGNTVIYTEYDEIGIDATKFSQNDIKNGYILIDNLIPVYKDNLWGIFDKTGKLVVDFKYTELGYIATSNKEAINLLVIPNYDMIVVSNNGKYGLINISGEEKLATIADDIYMTIESGTKHYNILANDNIRDAEDYLDYIGIVARNENGEVLNENTINNNSEKNNNNNNTTNNSNATEQNNTNKNKQGED